MQQANKIVFIMANFFFFRKQNPPYNLVKKKQNIPHSRAGDLEVNIPSDCRSEHSAVKVRIEKEGIGKG